MAFTVENNQLFVKALDSPRNWNAIIKGLDPKYGFKREFINVVRDNNWYPINIPKNTILEVVVFSWSGKSRRTKYYLWNGTKLKEMDKQDVINYFAKKKKQVTKSITESQKGVNIIKIKTKKKKKAIKLLVDVDQDGTPDEIRIYTRTRQKGASQPASALLSSKKKKSKKRTKKKK